MLKPITRKEWTAALRSGEYPQGRGMMQSAKGYCCLGLACMLAGVPEDVLMGAETSLFDGLPYDIRAGVVNEDAKAAGVLYTQLGLSAGDCEEFAVRNDAGWTFDRIADLIDAMPFRVVNERGFVGREVIDADDDSDSGQLVSFWKDVSREPER